MRVVYRKVNGVASDIRFADPVHVLAANELELEADVLPGVDALSDPAVLAARAGDATRLSAIDDNLKATTIGTLQPATVAQLKAMTLAEYSSWFDANFGTAALLVGLLKRLTLVVIRRVL